MTLHIRTDHRLSKRSVKVCNNNSPQAETLPPRPGFFVPPSRPTGPVKLKYTTALTHTHFRCPSPLPYRPIQLHPRTLAGIAEWELQRKAPRGYEPHGEWEEANYRGWSLAVRPPASSAEESDEEDEKDEEDGEQDWGLDSCYLSDEALRRKRLLQYVAAAVGAFPRRWDWTFKRPYW